eukprot:CFRG7456T1
MTTEHSTGNSSVCEKFQPSPRKEDEDLDCGTFGGTTASTTSVGRSSIILISSLFLLIAMTVPLLVVTDPNGHVAKFIGVQPYVKSLPRIAHEKHEKGIQDTLEKRSLLDADEELNRYPRADESYEEPPSYLYNIFNSMDDVLLGRQQYLNSKYVCAGDRSYLVGFQDGSFPDIGWHIQGEMGGLWAHPIKLLDGFVAKMTYTAETIEGNKEVLRRNGATTLDKAVEFANYPIGNTHTFMVDVTDGSTAGMKVMRSQVVPDPIRGLIVEYTITNTFNVDNNNTTYNIQFLFDLTPDLRPVWLGDMVDIVDGPDEPFTYTYEEDMRNDQDGEYAGISVLERNATAYIDQENGWVVMATQLDTSSSRVNIRNDLESLMVIRPGESAVVRYVIAGGLDIVAASTDLIEAKNNWRYLTELKAEKYRTAAETSDFGMEGDKYSNDDGSSDEWMKDLGLMFRWLKYNSLWLAQEVVGLGGEAVKGAALTAGLEDYPWYFGCDSEYSILGLNAVGMTTLSENTIALLHTISENANKGSGRVVHEFNTNGVVYNYGNLNETPQFVSAVWSTFGFTGDITWLKNYYEFLKRGMFWLVSPENDPDGDGIPNGPGMMEIPNMDNEMIDVAVYTARAWMEMSKMAQVLGYEAETVEDFESRSVALVKKINKIYWVDSKSTYADVRGTPEQAKVLVIQALERARRLNKPWAVKELEDTLANIDVVLGTERAREDNNDDSFNEENRTTGYVTHHNWVVNTPMEVGLANPRDAALALQAARNYTNPFGLFVTGIDRDETAEHDWKGVSEYRSKEIFSYVGAVMTLGTGVLAVAHNNYGESGNGLKNLEMLTRSFGYALPGSQYEVSPDFGMMVQAWNIYATAYPIVCQYFGIEPYAYTNVVYISHSMPKKVGETYLNNVLIGKSGVIPSTMGDSKRLSDYTLYFKVAGSCVGATNTGVGKGARATKLVVMMDGLLYEDWDKNMHEHNECMYVALTGNSMSIDHEFSNE